jgi:hypothetical protein
MAAGSVAGKMGTGTIFALLKKEWVVLRHPHADARTNANALIRRFVYLGSKRLKGDLVAELF